MRDNDYEDSYTKYDGLWGESLTLLKHRLVFQRNSNMTCIYCGMDADTREHCPPKSFLKKPYPDNLKQLPACKTCNNSFSLFENQFMTLMNCFEAGEKNQDIIMMSENHILPEYAELVLKKVAIGHAVYQLSDGFGDTIEEGDICVDYILKNQATQKEWDDLQMPEIINVISELGSRASNKIVLIEGSFYEEKNMRAIPIVDWIEVQPNIYKYLVYLDGQNIIVKMMIRNLMFVKVVI